MTNEETTILSKLEVQLITAPTSRGSPFQADGDCGKRPSARATSCSPDWPGTAKNSQWELRSAKPADLAVAGSCNKLRIKVEGVDIPFVPLPLVLYSALHLLSYGHTTPIPISVPDFPLEWTREGWVRVV
ncbi:hypothetical protein UY3_07152 [Chelonia mydas]|uniref:Uncharacterized protein n=1 Tax=Chelonia mydas TaxID=8469 RepID=M7BCI0_CHEMY|nr:hypothetical protein UY3_07152 [Chelonia mydas]